MYTRRSSVTFRNAFKLQCFSDELPAGTYEISTIDEEVDDAPRQEWRRVSTLLCTPSVELQKSAQQWTSVSKAELDEALLVDRQTVRGQNP